ncbi:MAG: hypothetical protein JWN30_451 [Bacilli bacterium]|nr:hypothetical protein [Bacilli bacterium]
MSSQRVSSPRFYSYSAGSAAAKVLCGLLVAGILANLAFSKLQPVWMAASVRNIRDDTLKTAIGTQLPLNQTSMQQNSAADKGANPLMRTIISFLAGVDIRNPASLLGVNVPGMASLTTNLQGKQVDNPPPSVSGSVYAAAPGKTSPAPDAKAPAQPVVYIYHTHNWESFLPDLGKPYLTASLAVDQKINITQVGAHLTADLNQQNIQSIQTAVDYWSGGYNEAYNNSRKTAIDELKKYSSIQYVFDIHRDSDVRDVTTTSYHGQAMARVRWVIGSTNPNWKVNYKFAVQLNNTLNKLYPADPGQQPISRGEPYTRFFPEGSPDDSRYNQDLKPDDVLIEIGGPYNSIEECNRTADALAEVIKSVVAAGTT